MRTAHVHVGRGPCGACLKTEEAIVALELLHARLYAAFGDQDDGHTRGEWMTLLAQANAALGKAGL